jgi:hypothetical protein
MKYLIKKIILLILLVFIINKPIDININKFNNIIQKAKMYASRLFSKKFIIYFLKDIQKNLEEAAKELKINPNQINPMPLEIIKLDFKSNGFIE